MLKKWRSFRENLIFLVKILWKFDKYILFYYFTNVVAVALFPYVMIFVPKLIISGIQNNISYTRWGMYFVVLTVSGVLLKSLIVFSGNHFKTRLSIARNGCFGDMLSDKMFKIRYDLLENTNIQDLCFRSNMLFWSDNNGMAGVFQNLSAILSGVLSLFGYIIILGSLHIIVPIVISATVFINYYGMKKVKQKEESYRNSNAKLDRETEYLDDTMRDIQAGKDIRLFQMQTWLYSWYQRLIKDRVHNQKKIQNTYLSYQIVSIFLDCLREIFIYGSIVLFVLQQRIDISDFLMYLSTTACFSSVLVQIIESINNAMQFITHTNDFQEMLRLEEETNEKNSDQSILTVKWEDVSFQYPGRTDMALSHINLDIKTGEHIAIVGRNGSGKSTFVKLLVGLYKPSLGTLFFVNDNHMKEEIKGKSLFSAVFQKIYQYAFTLKENISFQDKKFIDNEKVGKAILLSDLNEIVKELPYGLETMLRKDFDPEGITLSMGQAQKLALTRAIYQDTPIVILDEPTSALDPLAEHQLYLKFSELFREKTCMFISHRLSSTIFCDRVIMMEDGKIIGDGSHMELLHSCKEYKEMWDIQSRRYKGEHV